MGSILCFILYLFIPIGISVANVEKSSYPSTYDEARKQFLRAIWELKKNGLQFEHEEFKIESRVHPELMVDSVYIPPLKIQKRLVILSTGVHGSEAPFGSALQVAFLRENLNKLNRDEDGIWLIHAMNPYGFFSGRRVTENNVDLNRNFLLTNESFWKQSNTAYDEFKKVFAPTEKINNSRWERAKLTSAFMMAAVKGKTQKQKLTRAFAQGQYSDPKGIYYGGVEHEPQVKWFEKLLAKRMRGFASLLHFDVHTGLGRASELQLISSLDTDLESPVVSQLKKSLSNQRNIRIVSPRTEGFYVTSGDLIDFVYARAIKAGLKAAAFTAEFGTLGDDLAAQLKTSLRIILENRAKHWGVASKVEEEAIKRDFRELFDPSDIAWRTKCLDIGLEALRATFKRDEQEQSYQKAQ